MVMVISNFNFANKERKGGGKPPPHMRNIMLLVFQILFRFMFA